MIDSKKNRMLLIDDNILFRNVLKQFVTLECTATIIAEYDTIAACYLSDTRYTVDSIILNSNLVDRADYIKNHFKYNNAKIIAIVHYTDKLYLNAMIDKGIDHCVSIDNVFSELHSLLCKTN